MAYQELIKDFQKIRDYIRDFYLYGFKTREDFDRKSLRSYDDKRRQIENWLGDFVKSRQSQSGKALFLAIDSRSLQQNPLYRVWKSKSFTDGDIVLHFYLLDILKDSVKGFTIQQIITSALDSEILLGVLKAIGEKRKIRIQSQNREKDLMEEHVVIPLKVFISVQNGRQYAMTYSETLKRLQAYRIDNIITIKELEVADNFDSYRNKLDKRQQHMWGVNTRSFYGKSREEVSFTIVYNKDEEHIVQRMLREKRCGKVKIDEGEISFRVKVYDAGELIPWIRSFICRIKDLKISNPKLNEQFIQDLQAMYRIYGLEGCENDI